MIAVVNESAPSTWGAGAGTSERAAAASAAAVSEGPVAEQTASRSRTTDPEVVAAAQRGCARSFASLYDGMGERVRLTAVCILRDDHLAEDAVQETFLAAFEGLSRLTDPRSFETWILRIARNKAVSTARRRRRMVATSAVHRDECTLGGAGVVARWGGEEPRPLTVVLLRSALRELPPHASETLRLRYVLGLSCREISGRLGVSVACVKTRLHRGRSALYAAVRAARG